MTRVLTLLVSCAVAALVFLAAAGVSDVPVWVLALSLTFWAALVGLLIWQRFANRLLFGEISEPMTVTHRSGPAAH